MDRNDLLEFVNRSGEALSRIPRDIYKYYQDLPAPSRDYSIGTALTGGGNYLADEAIRMATRGKYGLHDVYSYAGLPDAASQESISDFHRAYAPQLKTTGDLASFGLGASPAVPNAHSYPQVVEPELSPVIGYHRTAAQPFAEFRKSTGPSYGAFTGEEGVYFSPEMTTKTGVNGSHIATVQINAKRPLYAEQLQVENLSPVLRVPVPVKYFDAVDLLKSLTGGNYGKLRWRSSKDQPLSEWNPVKDAWKFDAYKKDFLRAAKKGDAFWLTNPERMYGVDRRLIEANGNDSVVIPEDVSVRGTPPQIAVFDPKLAKVKKWNRETDYCGSGNFIDLPDAPIHPDFSGD